MLANRDDFEGIVSKWKDRETSGPKTRPADSDEPDKTGKTKGYAIESKKKLFMFKAIKAIYTPEVIAVTCDERS